MFKLRRNDTIQKWIARQAKKLDKAFKEYNFNCTMSGFVLQESAESNFTVRSDTLLERI